MQGFLLIDKPSGMTSHDVVDQIRKLTGERKVGHAGTLDPFATGLLILGVGPATKRLGELVGLDKEYEATFILGARSDTDDPEGPIVPNKTGRKLTRDEIESAMQKYLGEIEQIPPKFAAIKVKGKKLYEAARAGEEIERKPRSVRIDEFKLLYVGKNHYTFDPTGSKNNYLNLKVRIKCSSGTYIRALARDLGDELGVGGYVSELRRTAIGKYKIKNATPLKDLSPDNIQDKLINIFIAPARPSKPR